jgi:hypothetical protein
MCFPWKGTVRHNSGGPIAPQLGQFSQKSIGRVAECHVFRLFLRDLLGKTVLAAEPRSLATGGAMGERMPA